MNAAQTIIQRLSTELQGKGYLLDTRLVLEGIRGLLYASSPKPYPLIVSKVSDHFLFLDWDNDLFGRKDHLVDAYQKFNRFVNAKFKVPHVLRMTIPNMAVIALSEAGFDADTLEYAQRTYQVPFKGGEVGQFFLVHLTQKVVTYHQGYVRKQYGSAPLYQAQGVLVPLLKKCMRDDYAFPGKKSAG